jgi:hypothetical protein
MTMNKTLSFQKETLRTLVSTELDAAVGGGFAKPTSTASGTLQGVAHPTSTAVGTFNHGGGGVAHPTSTAVGGFTHGPFINPTWHPGDPIGPIVGNPTLGFRG